MLERLFSMIEPTTKSELVSYPIRDIVQAAKKYENQGIDMLYLNIGDPAAYGFRPPQYILDAAAEALKQNYSGYAPSAGDPELVKEIAKRNNVSEDDVFVTAGLSEGIDFIFQALLEQGRNFLLPLPTYPLYLTKERINYGTINFYECDENYEPDLDSIRKNINELTKAILVINPNNPTGAVYSRKTVQGIIDIAGEHNLPIISDEIYNLMVFDGEVSNISQIAKDVPVVSGNGLSKNYIYPGARAGHIAFHGDGWDKVKDAMQRLCNQRLSVNWEMQRAYLAALRGPHDYIAGFNAELKKRRDLVVKRANEIDGLRCPTPKGAFYAYIQIETDKWKNDNEFVLGLLKHGVVAVPGSGFATSETKAFRIVLLPKPEQLEDAFNRIEQYMKE